MEEERGITWQQFQSRYRGTGTSRETISESWKQYKARNVTPSPTIRSGVFPLYLRWSLSTRGNNNDFSLSSDEQEKIRMELFSINRDVTIAGRVDRVRMTTQEEDATTGLLQIDVYVSGKVDPVIALDEIGELLVSSPIIISSTSNRRRVVQLSSVQGIGEGMVELHLRWIDDGIGDPDDEDYYPPLSFLPIIAQDDLRKRIILSSLRLSLSRIERVSFDSLGGIGSREDQEASSASHLIILSLRILPGVGEEEAIDEMSDLLLHQRYIVRVPEDTRDEAQASLTLELVDDMDE